MSELVKEIEGRIKACETLGYEGLVYTLQRAREALRWKSYPVNHPEEDGEYFVSIRFPFPGLAEPFTKPAYYQGGQWYKRNPNLFKTWKVEHVIAFMPNPAPYTPEES
jgi:hypothetical protein